MLDVLTTHATLPDDCAGLLRVNQSGAPESIELRVPMPRRISATPSL